MKKFIVLAISGKQGSGKTTLAQNLQFLLREKGWFYSIVHWKFAEPLYAMHDSVRRTLADFGWDVDFSKIDGPLLQLLGTEWGRNTINPNIWAELMRKRIVKAREEFNHDLLIIVDDCRFPNELAMLKEVGAKVVRLEAQEDTRKGRAEKWRENTSHPSEVALDGETGFDLKIDTNTYDADQTLQQVVDLVDRACLVF